MPQSRRRHAASLGPRPVKVAALGADEQFHRARHSAELAQDGAPHPLEAAGLRGRAAGEPGFLPRATAFQAAVRAAGDQATLGVPIESLFVPPCWGPYTHGLVKAALNIIWLLCKRSS